MYINSFFDEAIHTIKNIDRKKGQLLAGILIMKSSDYSLDSQPRFVLAGVDNVRIKKMVKPLIWGVKL